MKQLWLLIARNMCRNKLGADSQAGPKRREAEYYVAAYAQHYRVPVPLVRAVVERESNWRAVRNFSQRRSRPDAAHAHDCSEFACE